jgi:hypothetical protein
MMMIPSRSQRRYEGQKKSAFEKQNQSLIDWCKKRTILFPDDRVSLGSISTFPFVTEAASKVIFRFRLVQPHLAKLFDIDVDAKIIRRLMSKRYKGKLIFKMVRVGPDKDIVNVPTSALFKCTECSGRGETPGAFAPILCKNCNGTGFCKVELPSNNPEEKIIS